MRSSAACRGEGPGPAGPAGRAYRADVASARELCRLTLESEVASLSDLDATWGFKRKDEPFLGYRAHVVCDETGIVTAVALTPGHQSEQSQVLPPVNEVKERNPGTLYLAADKGYDAADLRKGIADAGIRPYIPTKVDADRLSRRGFRLDRRGEQMIRPAGKVSLGRSPHKRGGDIYYYFSQTDCQSCPRRLDCIGGKRKRKVLYLKNSVYAHRPRGLKRAMRPRKTIERAFAEAKTWHGMGRARYRGRWHVAIQVLLNLYCLQHKEDDQPTG